MKTLKIEWPGFREVRWPSRCQWFALGRGRRTPACKPLKYTLLTPINTESVHQLVNLTSGSYQRKGNLFWACNKILRFCSTFQASIFSKTEFTKQRRASQTAMTRLVIIESQWDQNLHCNFASNQWSWWSWWSWWWWAWWWWRPWRECSWAVAAW